MPVEEYPTLPQIAEQTGVLPAEDFSTAVAQVAVAASRDDVTPVITGVQLEVGDNSLSLVATDRYRVAVRDIDWDSGDTTGEGTTALIPARTLAEIGKTFAHSGHRLGVDRARRRPRAHRVQRRQEDRHLAAHQGQLPAGEAALPRDGRQLRRHQHGGAHRGDPPRVARARARGGPALHASRSTASRSRRPAPSRRRHRRPSTPTCTATTPSSRSSRRSCSTGSAPCTRSSCGSRSRRPRIPTSRDRC